MKHAFFSALIFLIVSTTSSLFYASQPPKIQCKQYAQSHPLIIHIHLPELQLFTRGITEIGPLQIDAQDHYLCKKFIQWINKDIKLPIKEDTCFVWISANPTLPELYTPKEFPYITSRDKQTKITLRRLLEVLILLDNKIPKYSLHIQDYTSAFYALQAYLCNLNYVAPYPYSSNNKFPKVPVGVANAIKKQFEPSSSDLKYTENAEVSSFSFFYYKTHERKKSD